MYMKNIALEVSLIRSSGSGESQPQVGYQRCWR
jgi:hypothetical protein